jgi:hypothetical protein
MEYLAGLCSTSPFFFTDPMLVMTANLQYVDRAMHMPARQERLHCTAVEAVDIPARRLPLYGYGSLGCQMLGRVCIPTRDSAGLEHN